MKKDNDKRDVSYGIVPVYSCTTFVSERIEGVCSVCLFVFTVMYLSVIISSRKNVSLKRQIKWKVACSSLQKMTHMIDKVLTIVHMVFTNDTINA